MKKLFKFIPILSLVAFYPFLSFAFINASGCDTATGLSSIICKINDLLSSILPVLIAFAVIYFIWGVVMYVIADGEEAKKTGRDRVIYGVIGLTVITSIWGLVNLLVVTFGLGGSTTPSLAPLTGAASACTTPGPKFQDLLCYVTGIINNSIIPLIFALAVVMFIWGVIKYFIIDADEEKKRTEGKQFMVWGIIALAVMLSVWGLVAIFGATFNIGTTALPQVKPPSGP